MDLDDLAARTEGYVGADIEAVCRAAAATAVREYVEAGADPDAVDEITLTMDHFEQALGEVEPSLGDGQMDEDGTAVTPMTDGSG